MDDPSLELFKDYEKQYMAARAGHWQVAHDKVRAYHLDRLPRWLDRIPRDARILDAGCANGYLLSLFAASGYCNLVGVELSAQLAAAARHRLAGGGEIVNADVRDFLAQAPDACFDVVLFHHVLEHIPREHTIALLREFYRVLKPGGYLNIKVPNASYLLAGNHLFCDFTHVVHFNERSLPQVLEAAGFSRERIEFIPKPPLLFWSWRHPVRMGLRLLNRLRWHIHKGLHLLLCALVDLHPAPKMFEVELEALAQK
jgi:SAM-dependent methyltransferase